MRSEACSLGMLLMALSVVACSFDTGSAASTNGESLGRSESSASGGRGESSDDSSGEDTVDSQGGSADETSGDGGSAITGDDPGTCEGPCAADVPGGWDGPFYVATVTIDSATFNFGSNNGFRFRCDASGNNDRVYIDEITIRAR